MKLFLQKNAKFSSAGGSALRPRASGGSERSPQIPQTAPPAPLRISAYAPDSNPLFLAQSWLRACSRFIELTLYGFDCSSKAA